MKAFASACIILAICVAASLQDTPYNRCENGPPPTLLVVDECNSSPCGFYRGTNLTAHWNFKAIANTEKLTTRVRVTIMGITIIYPYPYSNACESLTNSKCPLNKGDDVTYNLVMPISKNYPSVELTIEFSLFDQNGTPQVCFLLDGQVKDK
ncbi:Epididymal secretory protein E1 [Trachymyrmex zeteki]|uniref:Epididymal secretory protein E1 n=1 Tax=Mycetomoellerius zeteki TaxID=64791 RepID=A0A151WUV1_9HYME|nr:PREDICTED: epididymal secretory protein E1-like [Trachymyrmex zeteki]KYQ51537.1 Epididymal secretory protein E1 [Trachymyrmex zeteki]